MALAGVDSVLSGDNFAHGVISAGLGMGAGALSKNLGRSFEDVLAGTILSAIASGTGSLIAGGKFGTGALSGAMRYAFNKTLHDEKEIDRSKLSRYELDKFDYFYIDSIDDIGKNIDTAIDETGFFDWLSGAAGENIDQLNRYILGATLAQCRNLCKYYLLL